MATEKAGNRCTYYCDFTAYFMRRLFYSGILRSHYADVYDCIDDHLCNMGPKG